MSKHKIIFVGDSNENIQLEVKQTHEELLTISIQDYGCDHQYNYQIISLDKPTAIKLSRVLKSEISKLKSDNNG